MRTLLLTFAMVLTMAFGASAQVFKIGVRGGVNITDNNFSPISTGDYRVSHLPSKVGYQVALVTRISIPRFLQISPEFQMVSHTYRYRVSSQIAHSEVSVAVRRFEIPITVGFNIWALRLFGGPVFRVAQNEKVKNSKSNFKVYHNDADVAFVAGAGLDLGKFFVDARYNFYPKKVSNRIEISGTSRTAKVRNSGMWQFSAGFFF